MASLIGVLTATVLPVLAVAGVGYALGRYEEVDVGSLNTVTLYVLTPALVFESLATTSLSGATVADVAVGFTAFTLAMVVVGEGFARVVGVTGSDRDAMVVTSAFPNVGNFGIPVAAFAFGAVGRSTAVLVMVTQTVIVYTFGAYLTTRNSGVSLRDAIRGILRIPVLYAVPVAVLVRALDAVPSAESEVMRTVGLLADAAIPMFLLVLGLQLGRTESGRRIADTLPAIGLKSVVAPVVGVACVFAFGIDDPAVAGTFLIGCAAPAAITPLLFLIEFGGHETGSGPTYASTVIVTTLATCLPAVGLVILAVRSGLLP